MRESERDAVRRDFGRRVEQHLDALHRVASRLARNATEAEDLVADTVVQAWRAFDTLLDRERFRPWILQILRRRFLDAYRKRANAPALLSLDDVAGDEHGEGVVDLLNAQSDDFLKWWATPDVAAHNRLLGEQILAAIDALPEVFRITILLVNVDGLGYDEAAAVLGVPPGTVRSRMKRGRTLLQKALWTHARDAGIAGEAEEPR